jgi:hypothetical protein
MKRYPALYLISFALSAVTSLTAFGQQDSLYQRPTLEVGKITNKIKLDGVLDEPEWRQASVIERLTMVEPQQGAAPTLQTRVQVLADKDFLVFGVYCEETSPQGIVSISKVRDANLSNQDYIRLVLDPFQDGRSGFIFSVNPAGARYDALVTNQGESEDKNWDAVWDARTYRDSAGWSIEIMIPAQSLSFKRGLHEWWFNIERRVQRLLEVDRWSNPSRDQWFIQTSRAGVLTHLPDFDLGIGLNVRPALIFKEAIAQPGAKASYKLKPTVDITQRLGSNVATTLTFNTDFAETEVDTRQTNLTRFPLLFPEKRAFFLDRIDVFNFGFGASSTVTPFFSRRIGLASGREIPINAGLKTTGRIGNTNFGAVVAHTGEVDELANQTTTGVVRVRQNVLRESSAGVLFTFGDPLGKQQGWTGGADFTFQTTRFQGNKNFLVGFWGLTTQQKNGSADQNAFGIKIDYPNDRWDIAFTYSRLGEGFEPLLGFVPRRGIHFWRLGATFAPRPEWKLVRQMFHELFLTYYANLDGDWESYRVFTAPINWRLESGERFEFNIAPQGEQLFRPFEIAENVTIPEGPYHFVRYRLEAQIASKRKLSGLTSWWFGPFYKGNLHEISASLLWRPSELANFEFTGVRNMGNLPFGDFIQNLVGFRVQLNFSPNLQANTYVQYDNETDQIGTNNRLRWTFSPLGDLFVVYNHNMRTLSEGTFFNSNQFLLKLVYNFRK